jgi:HD-GYP domain-containing protein (c-di-GMP phosphodiesterase class II)
MLAKATLIVLGAAALIVPLGIFVFLYYFPAHDPLLMHSKTHFWSVGATSLAAVVACAIMVASARTLRETRLLFLTLAFASIAGIFSVHGLMTPGVMVHEFYASVSVSAWLSVIAGSIFAALSAASLPQIVDRFVRRAGGIIFAWALIAIGAYIVLSFTVEEWLNGLPITDRNWQYGVAIVSTALLAFAAWRYGQAYLFARLPSQAAMTGALLLLCEVPAILLWGTTWHLSWWMYHAIYLEAFVVLLAGWALEAKRAGSLRAISDALSMRDALAQLNRGRERPILDLVEQLEAKDHYTVGHVHRVGSYAFEIGRQLGLTPPDLRDVVLAAQMHDIGKLNTPDTILFKPAKLTDEEFDEMRKHAARSGEIARRVRALSAVASAVRSHHEQFAGGGYPDGIAGDAIPLIARIVSVADTYDAMTSTRPYRKALTHEAALTELQRVSGTQLDPTCVDAFLSWFATQETAAA